MKNNDTIYRQEAINAVKKWYDGMIVGSINGLVKCLNAVPSAQQEPATVARDIATIMENEMDMRVVLQSRKRGKWIWDENGMDWGLGAWKCSECKTKAETWWATDKKFHPLRCSGGNFCGVCGADMRGGAE